ncbi:MAG: YifB family Mg chelatase-like AAA ATPase, partial [Actinomycetota bacterium]
LLTGSPGSGKTMLARRLPGILPEMTLDEAFEVTRIRSVAGLLPERASLVTTRPFRVPHHHVSLAGLVGGGTGIARPGEVTLAHNGVLFLDELTLYSKAVLESLRAPLEDEVVRIARSGGSVTYPCRFSLVAAMNPCPCGYEGDPRRACRCEDYRKEIYRARLSGPLLDRFDMQVSMQRLTGKELMSAPDGEDSATVRARVEAARAIQARRYGSSLTTNASVRTSVLREEIALSVPAHDFARRAVDQSLLTGRGLDRLMRVARTIADLDGLPMVDEVHIGRALQLRTDIAAPVMA